jgi:hypothetical protein
MGKSNTTQHSFNHNNTHYTHQCVCHTKLWYGFNKFFFNAKLHFNLQSCLPASTYTDGNKTCFSWCQLIYSYNSKSKSNSKSLYDLRSVIPSVLVSSPVWGSWPDINYCLSLSVLSWGGRPLWREGGSVLCQSLSEVVSQLSNYTSVYILHVFHVSYTVYTGPLSVRAKYWWLCPNL